MNHGWTCWAVVQALAFAYALLAVPASAFYGPAQGRWLSRDPIGEEGGANDRLFLQNGSVNDYDRFGLWGGGPVAPPWGGGGGNFPPVVISPPPAGCPPCPTSYYPYYGPKIEETRGAKCPYRYRTSQDRGLPQKGNGCGSDTSPGVPDSWLKIVSFTGCCNVHDACYGGCGNSKVACDVSLGNCMSRACFKVLWASPTLLHACVSYANLYPAALTYVGWEAYEQAQDENCVWKPCCK